MRSQKLEEDINAVVNQARKGQITQEEAKRRLRPLVKEMSRAELEGLGARIRGCSAPNERGRPHRGEMDTATWQEPLTQEADAE